GFVGGVCGAADRGTNREISDGTGSDKMPGSWTRRKRDNSVELPAGIRFSAGHRRRPVEELPARHNRRAPMSSFEWNKIIASVLTAMIVAMVAGILASSIVRPKHLEKAAYLPPGAEGEAGPRAGAGSARRAAGGPEPDGQPCGKGQPAQPD